MGGSGAQCTDGQHVANATVRTDTRGTRIAKETKHSTRRIDLAVCAIMAHSVAAAIDPGLQLYCSPVRLIEEEEVHRAVLPNREHCLSGLLWGVNVCDADGMNGILATL